MVTFLTKDLSMGEAYSLITQSIIPRPIGFISTISKSGVKNLAPFSFFNALCSNPPYFGVSISINDKGGLKDSARNLLEVEEVVFNLVSHFMVKKMNVSAKEFSPEVDEFQEAGFTAVASSLVKPFRVKEALISLEARLKKVLWLGEETKEIVKEKLESRYPTGNSFLFLCQVEKFYFDEKIIDKEKMKIKHDQLDAVARCGGAKYARVTPDNTFELPRS